MYLLTVKEPSGTGMPTQYPIILADVRRLAAELQLALDAARNCRPGGETSALVDLHNRARQIAARLNRALAKRQPFEADQ